jgi:hypothetical protein
MTTSVFILFKDIYFGGRVIIDVVDTYEKARK